MLSSCLLRWSRRYAILSELDTLLDQAGPIATILVLEIWPMWTFIRWRTQEPRGEVPDTSRVGAPYLLNHIELGLVILIVFVASFMASGFGLRS